mmetsp:Transcript_31006/g.53329  ORF Transcript_31006/g.53329 Transcript_31006/m.53329 type:complete len:335 (+) Transcript_31006:593-1597(+)
MSLKVLEIDVRLARDQLLGLLPREELEEAQRHDAPEATPHGRHLPIELVQPVRVHQVNVLVPPLIRDRDPFPPRQEVDRVAIGARGGEGDLAAVDQIKVDRRHFRVGERVERLHQVCVRPLQIRCIERLAEHALPNERGKVERQRRLSAERDPHQLAHELEHLDRKWRTRAWVGNVLVHVVVDLVHAVRAEDHQAELGRVEVRDDLGHRLTVHPTRVDTRLVDERYREDAARRFAQPKLRGLYVLRLLECLHENALTHPWITVPTVRREGLLLVVQVQRDVARVLCGEAKRCVKQVHFEVVEDAVPKPAQLVAHAVLEPRAEVHVRQDVAEALV